MYAQASFGLWLSPRSLHVPNNAKATHRGWPSWSRQSNADEHNLIYVTAFRAVKCLI